MHLPRIQLRPRKARPSYKLGIRPHHLRYEVGKYSDVLISTPHRPTTKRRVWVPKRVGEQHNLITDIALDQLITSNQWNYLISYAVVGTGTAEPSTSDQTLESELARTNNPAPDYSSVPLEAFVANGVYRIEKGVEFGPDLVGGQNLTEWGWSPYSSANGYLTARELFRDDQGNPIALSIDTDQYLRLIYAIEITLGPLEQDVTIEIANLGTLTGVMRLSSLAGSKGMDYAYDYHVFQSVARGITVEYGGMSVDGPATYDESILTGDYTDKRIGAQAVNGRSRSTEAVLFEPGEGNHLWKTLFLKPLYKNPGIYITLQDGFEKDDQHTLSLDPWTISWDRA